MNKIKLIVLIVIVFFYSKGYSQVTIGNLEKQEAGALLQLKNIDGVTNGNSNANKGLALPRVELLSTSLDIVTYTNLSNTIKGATGDWDKDLHTGLLVYNVNKCIDSGSGLYVWSGDKWEQLGESNSPEIHYEIDKRPQLLGNQKYPYRTFGTAGTWMLENLRYIPDNTLVPEEEQMTESLGDGYSDKKYYTYPNQTSTGIDNGMVPSSWRPAQGILYTYYAATSKSNGSTTSYIQGVCPPNWHIPSDQEFNELEAHIQNNMNNYSTATTTQSWQIPWDTITGDQGDNLSMAMKSECNVLAITSSNNDTGGKSFSTNEGGFNILLTGFSDSGVKGSFGYRSYMWTSSPYMDSNFKSWSRGFLYNNTSVLRLTYSNYNLFSVRCKKDN